MPLVRYQTVTAEEMKPVLTTILQASARLYMHFARETIATFGQEGEMTVRQHLRDYGHWRGTEMREAHNAMGRPINVETLNRCWDSASVFIVKDDVETEGHYSPYDVSYDVRICPAAEAWKAEDFRQWGHVYCDEFHQSCASTYHPDGNVVIPINMMKGDDHCHFRWIIPAGSREVAPFPPSELGLKLAEFYEAQTPERGAYDAVVRTSRLMGGRYLTMVQATLRRHPKAEADACIRRWLRSWATQRGELLRETHLANDLPLDAASLMRDMDLACKYVWETTESSTTSEVHESTIDWTPMDDAWADLDAAEAARVFWEESLPALTQAYNPDLTMEIIGLRWRGDRETRIRVSSTRS